MLTHEENELLVRTGPGTPMGKLMRRYWIPALFSHQLPAGATFEEAVGDFVRIDSPVLVK